MLKSPIGSIFIGLGASVLLQTGHAFAYGQDVCFATNTSPTIVNCLETDKECHTDAITGKTLESCKAQSVTAGQKDKNGVAGGRSLIHEDAVYFLAQRLGFSPWQAYELLQFNAIPDMTAYEPFDQSGKAILTDDQLAYCQTNWGVGMPEVCLVVSPVLNGFSRFDSKSGGTWLHFQLPYLPADAQGQGSKEEKIQYQYPNTSYIDGPVARINPILNNIKDWAFGKRKNACVLGITQDMTSPAATTSPCADAAIFNAPVNKTGDANIKATAGDDKTLLGEYVLMRKSSGSALVRSNDESLQRYIAPQHLKMAKLGIYTHAIGDRYSHHVCSDPSYFSQGKDGHYQGVLNTQACEQGTHFWDHVLEQGTNQQALQNIDHVTMAPGLTAIFEQLVAFAQQEHMTIKPVDKNKTIQDLIRVLEIPDPQPRLDAMVKLEEDNGVLPLPGHGAFLNKTVHEWLVAALAPLDKVQNTSIDAAMKTSSQKSTPTKPELGER